MCLKPDARTTRGQTEMRKLQINGYVVVDAVSSLLSYRGVYRMAWELAGDDFYADKLSPELKEAYLVLDSSDVYDRFRPQITTKEIAAQFINHSRQAGRAVELIAVRSNYLDNVRGTTLVNANEVEFLGIDVVPLGEWSLIEALIFSDPIRTQFLTDFADVLNENILLRDKEPVARLEAYYRNLAAQNLREPTNEPSPDFPVEGVEVYLVKAWSSPALKEVSLT